MYNWALGIHFNGYKDVESAILAIRDQLNNRKVSVSKPSDKSGWESRLLTCTFLLKVLISLRDNRPSFENKYTINYFWKLLYSDDTFCIERVYGTNNINITSSSKKHPASSSISDIEYRLQTLMLDCSSALPGETYKSIFAKVKKIAEEVEYPRITY